MQRIAVIAVVALLVSVATALEPVKVVQTAKDNGDRLTEKPSVNFSPDPVAASINITVDISKKYQEIIGFGGALTESSAYIFAQLSSDLQQEIIDAYFGPSGNQYTICRTHINSCDFSLNSWSFDDSPGDVNLVNFTIEHQKKWMFPLINRALSATSYRLKLFATPWSPPAWMKTNNNMDGSNSPCLKPGMEPVWAQFISESLAAFHNSGIPMWGLTIQNEPEFAAPWEACTFTAAEERDFLRDHLGPVLTRDHPDLQVMIYDHNKDHVVDWVQTVFSDPVAAQYADGVAFHWYSGNQFENLAKAHEIAPNKFFLATEATEGPGVIIGDWGRGEHYGEDMIGDLQNWANGWVDWNIILDMQGGPNHLQNWCDAPIIADAKAGKLYYQIPYYYMGQITRFVVPDSYHIDTQVTGNVDNEHFMVVGFYTPYHQRVLIVMNKGDSSLKFQVEDDGQYALFDSPAHSIKTLIY
jgi:glucosylceramidase